MSTNDKKQKRVRVVMDKATREYSGRLDTKTVSSAAASDLKLLERHNFFGQLKKKRA